MKKSHELQQNTSTSGCDIGKDKSLVFTTLAYLKWQHLLLFMTAAI